MRCFLAEKSREWGCPSPGSSIDWTTTEKFPPCFMASLTALGELEQNPMATSPPARETLPWFGASSPALVGTRMLSVPAGRKMFVRVIHCCVKPRGKIRALLSFRAAEIIRNHQESAGISRNQQESVLLRAAGDLIRIFACTTESRAQPQPQLLQVRSVFRSHRKTGWEFCPPDGIFRHFPPFFGKPKCRNQIHSMLKASWSWQQRGVK